MNLSNITIKEYTQSTYSIKVIPYAEIPQLEVTATDSEYQYKFFVDNMKFTKSNEALKELLIDGYPTVSIKITERITHEHLQQRIELIELSNTIDGNYMEGLHAVAFENFTISPRARFFVITDEKDKFIGEFQNAGEVDQFFGKRSSYEKPHQLEENEDLQSIEIAVNGQQVAA